MIQTRTSSTGRQLETGRAEDFGLDPEGQRWITCCTDHGTLVGTATKALAMSSDSLDFCEECRADQAPETEIRVGDYVRTGKGTGPVTYRVFSGPTDGPRGPVFGIKSIDALNRSLTRYLTADKLVKVDYTPGF